MPVPKKRQSSSRQGKRRANWKLFSINLSQCPECGAPTLPHHACPKCGLYQGRKIIKIKEEKKEKAEKKTKEESKKEEKKTEKKTEKKAAKKPVKKAEKQGKEK
jgi:large subunit ribosomal protein L32